MKRVLVVTHAGGSPHHGPNMRWYYLGRALREIGIEVEIVSSSEFHKYTAPPDITRKFETQVIDGINYHWIKTVPYRGRSAGQILNQFHFVYGCFRNAQRLSARKPDVVVASSPHPFVVFPANLLARRSNARLIYEVRDLWPELLIELGGFSRKNPYIMALKIAEKYGITHADRVISVKPGDWEYFNDQYDMPYEKFAYIANGFLPEGNESPVPRAASELRGRYRFLIGYAGALSAYYGLEHLLELARRFKGDSRVGFVVVGKGGYADALREKATNLELEHFYMIGAVSKQEIMPILARLDACYVGLEDLYVHRYGISCNKIFEYMCASRPIIGSYRAGYDPVTAAGCGFVAVPGDYDPLVKGIKQLMERPDLAEEMGARGKSYFDANHDFRKVAQDVKRCLCEDAVVDSEAVIE